jgi:hypothetical protein
MKTTSRPGYMDWTRPHGVFDGAEKDAKKLCEELNKKAKTNFYTVEYVRIIN